MKTLFKSMLISLCVLAFNSASFAAEKGSADEAVALVKKAVAYLNANGKDKAVAEFNSASGQFVMKDLYVFINDMNGGSVAHGGNPKLVGRSMIELKDADGKYFIKEMGEVAKTKGKGWVDYKWLNPVTKALEAKSTYVEKVGDLVVGCGIYK
jgi:cytochrome c